MMMDQAERLRNLVKQADQAERFGNVIKQAEQHYVGTASVFTVTSGKGGVGKSNTAVNLAVWFRKAGKRVIIFDADFGLANVEIMFGTVPKYNLSDFIYRGLDLREIVTEGPMGIGFISGGSGIVGLNDLAPTQIRRLVSALSELNDMTDILIIDTGAGVSNQVLSFVLESPEVILLVTPDPPSITDSYSLVKALYRNPRFSDERTTLRLLANRVSSENEGRALYDRLSSIVSKFLDGKMSYLGFVPDDSALERAVRSQDVVSMTAPNAASSRAFERAASALLGNESRQEKKIFSLSGLFRNIFNTGKQ